MSNITIKKDSSTEFLRLIACLIVIGVHVKLGNIIDGRIIFSHIYIVSFVRWSCCFLADNRIFFVQ